MSYPLDVAAQNAALDALLGSGKASGVPSSWEVALFAGDPANGGTELTGTGGYVRVTVTNNSTNFPNASGGIKTAAVVLFAAPSAAWSDTANYWVFYDHADSSTAWFYGLLSEELTVYGTETVVQIQPALYWNVEA